MVDSLANQEVVVQLQKRLREVAGRDLRAGWEQHTGVIENALGKFIASFTVKVCPRINASDQKVLNFFREADFAFEFGQVLRGRMPSPDELLKIFRDSVECDQMTLEQFELDLNAALKEFCVVIEDDRLLWLIILPVVARLKNLAPTQPSVNFVTGQAGRAEIQADKIDAGNVVSGTQINVNQVNYGVVPQASLRSAYLHHLFGYLGRLDLRPINSPEFTDAPTHISLDALYTELYTADPRDERAKADEGVLGEYVSPSASALHRIIVEDRVLLLGSPGSGKSTFVNFLGLCVAGEQLGSPEANFATLFRAGYEDDLMSAWEAAQLRDRIPIRIILRDFVSRLPRSAARTTAEHVWEYIVNDLETIGLAEYRDELKQELLDRGGLVMFDGLDEIPDVDLRRAEMGDAISEFSHTFFRSRIIVTSRPYSYSQRGWALADFHVYQLAPFTRAQIASFIDRWYRCIGSSLVSTREGLDARISRLINAIDNNESLKKMGSSPLLLTLICSLHAWRNGELPETREELYDDAINLLLEWWEAPRIFRDSDGKLGLNHPSLTEWLKVDRDQVRKLLSRLAFEAHLSQKDLYRPGTISEESLIIGLTKISQNKDVRPQRLIEYLLDRAGVLVAPGNGFYTFPHLTFQEYLAACLLEQDGFPDKIAELVSSDSDRWWEVALQIGRAH